MKNKLAMFFSASLILLFLFFGSSLMRNTIKADSNIREAAKNKVDIIQMDYNKNKYLNIYNKATIDFKKITTEEDFISLMERKKEVLGRFVSSKLIASNVVNSNVVILTYRSNYSNYSLIEEFQFIRESKGDALQLGTYFIDDGGKRGEVIRL